MSSEQKSEHKRPSDQASARYTELGKTFDKILFSALDAIEEQDIPYALIGGIAASGLGRPRPTHDVDIFVRPEDAEAALAALAGQGFETERTFPWWLYKGFKDEMLVDIIFKSQGGIYFDDEMRERVRQVMYHERSVRIVSPEDLIIIKCAVHNEEGPHHWYDALAVLSHAGLDWDYLLRRARRAPRRLLALLIYAQSSDIWIPNRVIHSLYETIYRDTDFVLTQKRGSRKEPQTLRENPNPSHECKDYLAAKIQDAVAHDEITGKLDFDIAIDKKQILVKGDCLTEVQKNRISEVVHKLAPEYFLDNQLKITDWDLPNESEVLQ